MAEFCNQCSRDLGFPEGELTGLTSGECETSGYFRVVVCEGCGVIEVDPKGNCITAGCLRQHGVKKGAVQCGASDAL